MASEKEPPDLGHEEDDDHTVVDVAGPPRAPRKTSDPGLTNIGLEIDPDDLQLLRGPVEARNRGPRPDLPGFGDDDDDEDTDVLSKEHFLASHVELQGRIDLSDPPTPTPGRPPIRSLDSLGSLPLTAGSREGQAVGRGTPRIVAEEDDDDDDDDDDPATAVLKPPPRRLQSLMPIAIDDVEDVTLSRPNVKRATFRPSGEGMPQKRLSHAGGAPPVPWTPRGAKSVIALPDGPEEAPPSAPDEDAPSPFAEISAPRPLPPPGGPGARRPMVPLAAEEDDEGDVTEALPVMPSPPPRAAAFPTGEGTVTPVGPRLGDSRDGGNSETPTLETRAAIEVARASRRLAARQEVSDLDSDDELVVDDELPPEISSAGRVAPGPGPAAGSELEAELGAQDGAPRRALVEKAEADLADDLHRVPTDVGLYEEEPEVSNIADDEPGTLRIEVPAEATVFLDGDEVGRGPCSLHGLDRFTLYALRVHCRGYQPWSGSATLNGQSELSIKPALKPR